MVRTFREGAIGNIDAVTAEADICRRTEGVKLMNIINTHLKKVMAIENVNVKEAKETLLNRQINNRVSARLDRSIVNNERAILINHAEKGQVYESINNYINKSETLKKLGDDN